MLLNSRRMTVFISRDDFCHDDWLLSDLILIKISRHMKKIAMFCIAAFLLPASGWSHPGHGGHGEREGYTIIHYFTTMPHALVMWGVVIGAAIYFRHLYRKERKEAYALKQPNHARAIDRNRDH